MLDRMHNVVPEESTKTEGDSSTEYNKNRRPQEVSYLEVFHYDLFLQASQVSSKQNFMVTTNV